MVSKVYSRHCFASHIVAIGTVEEGRQESDGRTQEGWWSSKGSKGMWIVRYYRRDHLYTREPRECRPIGRKDSRRNQSE